MQLSDEEEENSLGDTDNMLSKGNLEISLCVCVLFHYIRFFAIDIDFTVPLNYWEDEYSNQSTPSTQEHEPSQTLTLNELFSTAKTQLKRTYSTSSNLEIQSAKINSPSDGCVQEQSVSRLGHLKLTISTDEDDSIELKDYKKGT